MLTGDMNIDMKILNELPDIDLINACRVNKKADEICTDQNFWLNRILVKFPGVPLEVLKEAKGDRTWSQYYIEDLRMNETNILKLYKRVDTRIITKEEFERSVKNIRVRDLVINNKGTTLLDYVFEVEDELGSYEPIIDSSDEEI